MLALLPAHRSIVWTAGTPPISIPQEMGMGTEMLLAQDGDGRCSHPPPRAPHHPYFDLCVLLRRELVGADGCHGHVGFQQVPVLEEERQGVHAAERGADHHGRTEPQRLHHGLQEPPRRRLPHGCGGHSILGAPQPCGVGQKGDVTPRPVPHVTHGTTGGTGGSGPCHRAPGVARVASTCRCSVLPVPYRAGRWPRLGGRHQPARPGSAAAARCRRRSGCRAAAAR